MTLRKIFRLIHKRDGFTLIEILVAVVISGLLAAGIMTAISQTITVNASSTSRMIAIKQIENAIDSIRQDVIQAQQIIPNTIDNGFPLTLKWIDWENEQHTVTYSWDDTDFTLTRDDEDSERVIAKNIESIIMLDPDTYTGGRVILTITATVNGYKPATEIRRFEIFPRPAQ
jgi:prepilin-type N-terminal cleavage/methylation domain-containing protein